MRFYKTITASCVALSLSACNLIQDMSTDSGFKTPTTAGSYSGQLSISASGRAIDSSGDGFAYAVGGKDGDGLLGYAGLVPGTDVNSRPSTGSGTFSGYYELARTTGININGDSIYGFSTTTSGAITLEADFEANTLTGESGELTVNGEIDGTTLSGNVRYRGLRGSLRGLVGSDKTVGAFHGNDADLIYSGGFLANRD